MKTISVAPIHLFFLLASCRQEHVVHANDCPQVTEPQTISCTDTSIPPRDTFEQPDENQPAGPTYWSAEATKTVDDLVFARVDGKPFFALGIHPSVRGGWDGSSTKCYEDPETGLFVGYTNDGYETTKAALEAGANFAFLWSYGSGPEWGALYHKFYGRWQWHWGTTKPKDEDVIPIIVNEYGEEDMSKDPYETAKKLAQDFEDFKARRGRWSPENAPNLPPYEEIPWFAWHPTWRMIGKSEKPGGSGSMLSHDQAVALARATNMMIGDNYSYVCNRWDSFLNPITGQKGEIGECYDDWLAWADEKHASYFSAAWDLASSLREKANPDTLIWMWIQGYSFTEDFMKDMCTKGYSDTWALGDFPTPRYLRKEIMSSVAAGATGIIFFGYGSNRPINVQKMLDILRALSSPDVYEPVLTSPRLDLGYDTKYLGEGGRVHVIVKWHAESRRAFVAGANPGPYRTKFEIEFPWSVAKAELLHWTVPAFMDEPSILIHDRRILWEAPEDEGFIIRITPLFGPDEAETQGGGEILAYGADDSNALPEAIGAPQDCALPLPDLYALPEGPQWPKQNAYSWDGSWVPKPEDFPLSGLFDDKYFDGHEVAGKQTPVLPPGNWDWNDAENDLAWWRAFESKLGRFLPLKDWCGNHFGWKLVLNDPFSADYDAVGAQFEGSSGTDVLNLGPYGKIHSASGQLGDGPDLLVFQQAWSLDFRTGSSLTGSLRDNDIVIAGCMPADGTKYLVQGVTMHTGPGSDWVFVRDIRSAAIDLGNGNGGRTDTLDYADGNDIVVLKGNVKDTRVFGGFGNDTIFWYIEEMADTYQGQAQGGNLFGGGGAGEALWGDPGVDRLVLVVPTDTKVVSAPPTPPGALLVMSAGDAFNWDLPTYEDPYAKYCYPCGVGPGGRKTIIINYVSKDGQDKTAGYVYVTAIEEIQVGIGEAAIVYRLDDVSGKALPDPTLKPIQPPDFPSKVCTIGGGNDT